ncbi:adenylyl-sulfate kinase [Pseudomonas sp. AO-1]|uniref:adenylyl-sulfate kinase n=1 Tax=Pseudomonas sp. AO-1 TaxID=2855434 RepID=UPI001C787E77|nr:adenylyl-sulfate kinase [Pseudomonas sp. AO-1]QXZ13844.1 adenylyl-sulfate kinase [Pseudomonas sp. AO-1]
MNEYLSMPMQAPAIRPYGLALSHQARAALKAQRPRCLWLTGFSGAGKSTLANALELHLHASGLHTFLLDGDNVRNGLCRDLGMSDLCRRENIRRMAEVARLMVDAGLIVIVAAISPFRTERDAARRLFAQDEFIEVHVSTSLEVCARRDPKGLYQAVREGRIKHFTGVDSPYEAPLAAEWQIDTEALELSESCEQLAALVLKK